MSNYILAKRASLYDSTGKWVGLLDLDGREQIVVTQNTPPFTLGESWNIYDATGAFVGVLDRNGKEQILANSTTAPLTLGESPFLFDPATRQAWGVLDVRGGEMVLPTGLSLPATANLSARWSADTITPQADNTALSTWTDSVNGYAATQATGINQPKYRANRLGGKPSVQFAGSQWLAGAFPALKAVIDSKVYTVIIALSNTVVQANGVVFGNGAGGNNFAFMSSGTVVGRYAANASLQIPNAGTAFTTIGCTSRNTAQYSLQSGTGLERSFVNGCCVASNTAAGPATSSVSGAFAFGANNDTGLLSGKADLYEVIIWNRVLTPMEMLQAESYLRAKYSQTLPWSGLSSFDLYMGDSLTVGTNANDASKSPAYVSAAARSKTPGQWMMWAVGGMSWTSASEALAEVSGIASYMGVPLNICAFEWYNEKNAGRTPAQIYANAQAFCTSARAISGAKLCLGSSTGYSTDGTDPYASVRGAYNALLDANFASMCDQYMPIHTDATMGPAIGNATAYATNSATNWSDIVHLTVAGYGILGNGFASYMNAMRA